MAHDRHHARQTDPEIIRLVAEEERRQAEKVRLIPSENYVSPAVLEATGTVLTKQGLRALPAAASPPYS
jgi:glycine/serine hydroxymethyltransferase